jgi:hypothetical protein
VDVSVIGLAVIKELEKSLGSDPLSPQYICYLFPTTKTCDINILMGVPRADISPTYISRQKVVAIARIQLPPERPKK